MAEFRRERSAHFRGKPRAGRRIEVRYRVIQDDHPSQERLAFTKNIGIGGAFIVAAEPAPPGARLRITIQVPSSSHPIEVNGEVRWIVQGISQPGSADPGMGVRFATLDVEQLVLLTEYFATLTETLDHDEA